MNTEVAARNFFAHFDGVTGRRIKRRIHEIEVAHARISLELLDLIHDQFRGASTIAPAFDVGVRTVDALEHAAAFCLNRNRCAIALISLQIDPAIERRRWK